MSHVGNDGRKKKRRKEHDWNVAEWQRSEQAQRQQRDRRDEELVH